MKILVIEKVVSTTVVTDESNYIRYGKNCWMVQMDESDEPVCEDRKLEGLYQEYIKEHPDEI